MFWRNRSARRSQPVSRAAVRRGFRPGVEALEDRWLPSTFSWFQNVDGDFDDAARWRDQNGNNGVPGPGDDANISGGGFTVTSSVSNTVRSLNANSRLTIADGTFTVGDAINTSVLSQLVLASGASFQVTAGTTFLTSGTESLGSMNVAAGAKLVISGGTHHLDSGTSLGGAGEYDLTGGTLSIDANVTAPPNFHLDGGTVTGAGTYTVTGSTMIWTGGEMSGLGGQTVIASDASLIIDGPGQKNIRNAYSLTTNGSVTWQGSGLLVSDIGATITNNGSWTVQGDLSLFEANSPDATFINTASGVFTKAAGPGTLYFGDSFTNAGTVNINSGTLQLDRGGYSTGTFNVAAGSALQFTRLTYTFAAGTTITGAGTTRLDGATLLINADTELPNFAMSGGLLGGTNTLTVDGSFTWTGGEMNGAGGLVSKGSLVIDGPGQKAIRNAYSLTTNGSVTWQGSGGLLSDVGATITNNGSWTVQGDLSLFEAAGPDGTFINTASGVFTKAAGPGTLYFGDSFTNAGTVNINSGTLQLDRGGYSTGTFNVAAGSALQFTRLTYTFAAGTTVTGAGTTRLDGATLLINADTELPNFAMSGGLLGGTNTLTVDGSFTWTGGEMNGAGSLVSKGSLVIDGPGQKNIRNAYRLTTNGSVTWQGNGGLLSDIGATITNNGSWTVQADLAMTEAAGPDGTFINTASGVFTKAAGPGTLYFGDSFTNAGTVNINSGTLQLDRGGYSTGTFNGGAGTALVFTRNTYTLTTGASLPSAGLVLVNGGAVVIDATVSVQSFELDNGSVRLTSNGILNVAGNYTQRASATLVIDIGGETAGAGYGQLNVAGIANLAGTLLIELTNDFSPSIGDSYLVLTFGSVNGSFGFMNMPNLSPGLQFDPSFGSGSLTLNVDKS